MKTQKSLQKFSLAKSLAKRPFFQGHGIESRGRGHGRQCLGLGRQSLGRQGLGRQGLGLESQDLGLSLMSQGLGLGCQGLGLGYKGLDNITAYKEYEAVFKLIFLLFIHRN